MNREKEDDLERRFVLLDQQLRDILAIEGKSNLGGFSFPFLTGRKSQWLNNENGEPQRSATRICRRVALINYYRKGICKTAVGDADYISTFHCYCPVRLLADVFRFDRQRARVAGIFLSFFFHGERFTVSFFF